MFNYLMDLHSFSKPQNIYWKRCENVQNQLNKHKLYCNSVHRHHLYGLSVYVLEFDNIVDESDIAEALDIPKDWIAFVMTSPWIYYVLEDKLHEKYCDEDGELIFDKEKTDDNMKMVSDVLKVLVDELAADDLSINVLVDGKLYDIKDFYFDKKIYEYVLELHGGYEYKGDS